MDIGFTIEEIHEYFNLRNGKCRYNDIVTHFKGPLSRPGTQAEARNKFKDWVNKLATVINEDNNKYLVLRPKYMNRLEQGEQHAQQQQQHDGDRGVPKQNTTTTTNQMKMSSTSSTKEHNDRKAHVPPQPAPAQSTARMAAPPPSASTALEHPKLPPNEVIYHQQSYYPQAPPPPTQLHRPPTFKSPPVPTSQYYTSQPNRAVPNNANLANHVQQLPPPPPPNHHHHHLLAHSNPMNVISHNDANRLYHANVAAPGATTRPSNNEMSNFPSSSIVSPPAEAMFHARNIVVQDTVDGNVEPVRSNSYTDMPPPRPPPRKKNSFKAAKTSTPASNDNDIVNKENVQDVHNQEVQKEIQELAKTPGRVKEHAEILNKLAESSTATSMPDNRSISNDGNNYYRSRNNDNDTDTGSVQLLDPMRKQWVLAACKCDLLTLKTLLQKDASLAGFKDLYGNTAAHWACKFNRIDIVKLLLGQYRMNPNIQNHCGYTPLHMASQFKNEQIIKMLINIYNADIKVRDFAGQKPLYYLEYKKKKVVNEIESIEEENETGHESGHEPAVAINPQPTSNVSESSPNTLNKNLTSLRNRITHQSMLVRNTLRKSKAFQRRKSIIK